MIFGNVRRFTSIDTVVQINHERCYFVTATFIATSTRYWETALFLTRAGMDWSCVPRIVQAGDTVSRHRLIRTIFLRNLRIDLWLHNLCLIGLKLILNIDQSEYLPHLTDAAGVRVVVHPQERMPFPQDEGVVAAPATLTSIGIRQVGFWQKIMYIAFRSHTCICIDVASGHKYV